MMRYTKILVLFFCMQIVSTAEPLRQVADDVNWYQALDDQGLPIAAGCVDRCQTRGNCALLALRRALCCVVLCCRDCIACRWCICGEREEGDGSVGRRSFGADDGFSTTALPADSPKQ